MNPIGTDRQTWPEEFDIYTQSFSNRSLQVNQIAAASQMEKDITIYTDEGDKVTLSFESEKSVYYANYQGQTRQVQELGLQNAAALQMQQVAVSGEMLAMNNNSNFAIAVEGDLNDQELKEIKTALQKIDTLMTDILYRNDTARMATTTAELRQLDSLVGIEADYQYKKAEMVQQSTLSDRSETVRTKAPVDSHRRSGRRRVPIRRMLNDLIQRVKASGVKPRMFARPLKELFKDFSGHMNSPHRTSPNSDRDLRIEPYASLRATP